MTATSPINGIQYPDLTNVKDQVAQFATMNTNIDTSGVRRYANAADRNARITSPLEGQVAYLNTENLLTYYLNGAWVVWEVPRIARKTVTEQVTAATTSLNADDNLYFFADANSTYRFELMAFYTGDTTVDAIKAGWTVPTSTTMVHLVMAVATGSLSAISTPVRFSNVATGGTTPQGTHSTVGGFIPYWDHGLITTGSTPGVVQWQWGKPTAYSTALQVGAGSFLSYTKIS